MAEIRAIAERQREHNRRYFICIYYKRHYKLRHCVICYPTKTFTVKIPNELDAVLENVSGRRKVFKSQVVREAIESSMATDPTIKNVSVYELMKDGIVFVGECNIFRYE
jgi:predicted DNA-binding protein